MLWTGSIILYQDFDEEEDEDIEDIDMTGKVRILDLRVSLRI